MPTRIGELLENPVTGDLGAGGEHIHPASTETFTVVRGQLRVRHGGRELQAGPGTRLQVAPGVAHDWWNAGAEEAWVVAEVQPGERFVEAIRHAWLLAQDGKTDAKGRPKPLQ